MSDEETTVPVAINIDPKMLDDAILRHIMQTSIGETIRKAIEETFSSKSTYGRTDFKEVISRAVDSEVQRLIIAVLQEPENETRIREVIREKMTNAVLMEFSSKAITRWLDRD